MKAVLISASLAGLLATASGWLAAVTARHEFHAERRARCEAQLELARYQYRAKVAELSQDHAGGHPDHPCPLVEEIRAWEQGAVRAALDGR